MITVNIRKQGGAAIITIPSNVLKILNVDVGTILELDVSDNELIVRPLRNNKRKHYTLAELLQGTTARNLKLLNKRTAGARNGRAYGRELE